MEPSSSKKQLLKRIAALTAENKELRKQNRALSETCEQLMDAAEQQKQSKTLQHDSKVKRFNTVTLLIAEMHGLSDLMENSSDASFIDQMDECHILFNDIANKHKLVRVHSIGDTFIFAGSIPVRRAISPISVTLAAMEMLQVVKERYSGWSMHIGIHTGSVNAVDGAQYRLGGDAIHVASRIVSVCPKDTILVSATSYELIKELFACTYTGRVPVKYHNTMELFSVVGIQEELSENSLQHKPNKAFRTKFLLMQFGDMQEHILDMLENELPKYLHYHNVKHTVDVVTQSELLGWAEGLNEHQLLMLKTAALFHDTGHIISYIDHEERGTEIARRMLPEYGYTEDEINDICRIIMATKIPPHPTDMIESIICDADLDYLGRTDFIPVSNTLYEELKAQGKMTSLNEWNKMQLKFIGSHQYFTQTGRKLREVKKQEQIERIRQLIE